MPPAEPARSLCPSCGRFVGPLESCPYCGASVKKRLPLGALRLGALVLAIAGIAILLYATSGAAAPTIKIATIAAGMNYAYVRIEGRVTRGPLYNPDTGEIAFYVADETGEIRASAFRSAGAQLLATGKVPEAGDGIAVEGALRVRDEFQSLTVQAPERLSLVKPPPRAVDIREIGAGDQGQVVSIRGDVRELRTPYTGLTLITVGDTSGEIDLAIPADIERLFHPLPLLQVGDPVRALGTVSLYRDAPQLAITHPEHIEHQEGPAAISTTVLIARLDASRVNQRVQVAGQITRTADFSQGLRATLDDGSGEIALVLWDDLLAQMSDAGSLQPGTSIVALGKLSEYRGALELVPGRPGDVRIVSSAALLTPTVVAANSGQPTRTAAIDPTPGASAAPTNAAAIPPASAAAVEPTGTAPTQAAVAATIQPTSTRRPTRTPTAVAVAHTIAELSAADKGTRVIVTGAITRTSGFSKGVRYTLDDGRGQIVLLIWSDVLEKIADTAALVPGARVEVTGEIDVFDNTLEIIPARANDVLLLARSTLPTPAPRTIASISSADLDRVVILSGSIAALSNFSSGVYLDLKDDTGTMRVTVFSNLLAPVEKQLAVGVRVRITGKINLYRGEYEIIPEPGGITVEQ